MLDHEIVDLAAVRVTTGKPESLVDDSRLYVWMSRSSVQSAASHRANKCIILRLYSAYCIYMWMESGCDVLKRSTQSQ